MAIQLAWYKTRGEFTAIYEAVLTRMFKHGGTETLRASSRESRHWVFSMLHLLDSVTSSFLGVGTKNLPLYSVIQ